MVFRTAAETNRRITRRCPIYIFCGGQSRKLYSVKLRSMNPVRVQAKHDVDQWSKKQRRRRERKYILIGQATQGVSFTCKGGKKIFCIFWDKRLTSRKLFIGQEILFNIFWEKATKEKITKGYQSCWSNLLIFY